MIREFALKGTAAVIAMALCVTSAAAEKTSFIAGTAPSARPAEAPQITVFTPAPEWRAQALHGVAQPYPPSLSWLDDQGAWFTPFIHPGMTGPYDIRGWHSPQ